MIEAKYQAALVKEWALAMEKGENPAERMLKFFQSWDPCLDRPVFVYLVKAWADLLMLPAGRAYTEAGMADWLFSND